MFKKKQTTHEPKTYIWISSEITLICVFIVKKAHEIDFLFLFLGMMRRIWI